MERRRYKDASMRLQGWDYGSNGSYFITICTSNRDPVFGSIKNQQLNFSHAGIIAQDIWNKIPDVFPFAKTGAFVVMPDHIHGIITIDREVNQYKLYKGTRLLDSGYVPVKAAINRGPTEEVPTEEVPIEEFLTEKGIINKTYSQGGIGGDKNPMFHENISRIVRWYKGRCTYEIRKINKEFCWQSLFYDHIIKSERAYRNIVKYIEANPKNWENRVR